MSRKSITIFTPSYNHGIYIERALEKIVNQSRQPDEVLAVDDASTDDTTQIIKKYSDKYPFVTWHRNKVNQGATQVAVNALYRSKGSYFCGVGADDPLEEGFVEATMSLLEKYPEAGLCCAEYRAQSTNGESWNVRISLSYKPTYISPAAFVDLLRNRREVSLATCTTVWKKTALQELGGVIPALRWHYDWFNAVVIAFRYGFCYIPKIYQTVCYDPNSYSISGQRDWKQQYQVLISLFHILDGSEYSDVKHYFRIPAVISKFGPLLLCVLLTKEKWQEYLSCELIQYVLHQDVESRNIKFCFQGVKSKDIVRNVAVQIAHEVVAGLAAQYRAKMLYEKNYGDVNSVRNSRDRANILGGVSEYSNAYVGLAFRFHNYWKKSRYLNVRCWMHLIEELPIGICVAIYGTGQFGRKMRKMLQIEREDVIVECFLDRENQESIDGLEIVIPSQLDELTRNTIDCVLLCSIYYTDIYPTLKNEGILNIACVDAGEVLNYFQ